MQDRMIRLGGFVGRRRKLVIGIWLIVLLAALPLTAHQSDNLTGGGFDVPGSQSKAVAEAIERDYSDLSNGIAVLLLAGIDDPSMTGAQTIAAAPSPTRRQVEAALARVEAATAAVAVQEGEVTVDPRQAAAAPAALRARGLATIELRSPLPADKLVDVGVGLRKELDLGVMEDGITTFLLGQNAAFAGLQEVTKRDLIEAEAIGLPIVALILLAVFGTLAAAALPFILGVVSVSITGAIIYLLSLQTGMSVFVTNMASMLGIGVAVDYSLFVLARYREERRRGLDPDLARSEALASSGLAVMFSGAAVIISLGGLFMIDNQAMRSMAAGAMIVVFISILGAVTLLPAMISLLGERVESKHGAGSTESVFWTRWTHAVMARPWPFLIGITAFLLFLATPVLSLKTGSEPLNQFSDSFDVPRGAKIASAATGGGADEIQIVATLDRGGAATPANAAALTALRRDLAADPGIVKVGPVVPAGGDPRASSVMIQALPAFQTGTEAADRLLERLRGETVPGSDLAGLAKIDLGGEAARVFDVRAQIDGSMWKLILFILAFSFVMLMMMLRSLVLPLKAVLMNLLGVSAAYGILVVVFQWGWLDGILGFRSMGAIDIINVPLILAVVFGLSMDYEVFLLSRIRERWLEHGDNQRAVAEGLASSARTISSAAAIMTAVFLVFILTGVPSIKEIGLGTAIAIALDATLVRLILVPAAMKLLGDWNWWLPGWLDRILPDMSFEGGTGAQPEPDPVPPAADQTEPRPAEPVG